MIDEMIVRDYIKKRKKKKQKEQLLNMIKEF